MRPDGSFARLDLPLTPLPDTTVLTNAPGEPAIQHELSAEIPSAVSVDILMAFVRWSGVRPLLSALRRYCEEGGRIRVLTTTYTNSTEARALDALASVGAQLRVSYDTTTTRLHAKAWLFHRHRGAAEPSRRSGRNSKPPVGSRPPRAEHQSSSSEPKMRARAATSVKRSAPALLTDAVVGWANTPFRYWASIAARSSRRVYRPSAIGVAR